MGYLVSWVTNDGIRPLTMSIEEIKNMIPPDTQKGFYRFISIVNYYLFVCQRRSHTLQNITNLMSNKGTFK